jgi:hypothetical protein
MERFLKEQEEKKKNEEEISDKKQPISVPPAKKPMIGRIGGLKKKPVQNRQITPQKVHKVFRDDSDSEPEEKKESKSSSSGPSAPPEGQKPVHPLQVFCNIYGWQSFLIR